MNTKRILRSLAVLVLLAAGATWLGTGANRGWTKTSVPVKTLDEVTGIEGISYQKKFLPGVDFLVAAFGSAALLAGASIFFRKPKVYQLNKP
jgi:fumarate hydratase class II